MLPRALRIMEYPHPRGSGLLGGGLHRQESNPRPTLNPHPFSNLGFADCTQVFGEPTLTAALLDRLTHQANIITCDWESFRLQESLKAKDITLDKG
jgi:hypothetical protein